MKTNRCLYSVTWLGWYLVALTKSPDQGGGRYYLPTPPLGQDMTQGQFFKRSLTGFEFRVFLLLYQLPHQGWRTQSVLLLTHSWRENKGVHTFPKGICPKVNVIARLEYELAYYDSAVHRFNHYTTRTPQLHHEDDPRGEEGRSQTIGWDPKTEVGTPPRQRK